MSGFKLILAAAALAGSPAVAEPNRDVDTMIEVCREASRLAGTDPGYLQAHIEYSELSSDDRVAQATMCLGYAAATRDALQRERERLVAEIAKLRSGR